jgi:T6SS, Transcription factor, DNA binding domain
VTRGTPLRESPCRSRRLIPTSPTPRPPIPILTTYDEEHLITYLRLLDADAQRADWRDVARIVLHLDPEHDSDRARRVYDSHLSRAKWMTEHGYRHVLRGGWWRVDLKRRSQFAAK